MITAEEARKNAEKHEVAKLDDINIAIVAASKKGQHSIAWHNNINNPSKQELMRLGFKVVYHGDYDIRDPRESAYWSISW